jgi:aryl-alcohol dehydrogenase-like predicted oxidoreductase
VVMPSATIVGLAKPASRVVCGSMVAEDDTTLPVALEVFDGFFAAGGTTFDTAHKYGEGYSDHGLGHWLSTRGVREQCVVIGKGAHTPDCDPVSLTRQLHESLDRLATDHLDVYLLHRDNLEVPVGEFVDVLNEHIDAGRVHAWGGSNWTAARIDESNAYAAAHGLVGMTVVSNQLSLARMLVPTFPGCLGASDPEFRAWLDERGHTLVAWSSQAAGFFTGLTPDGYLGHAWFDDDNLERRHRAEQLARELGVEPVTIALAWVLHQPANILPIIGPRQVRELQTSLAAVDVTLTPEQVAWLDLS